MDAMTAARVDFLIELGDFKDTDVSQHCEKDPSPACAYVNVLATRTPPRPARARARACSAYANGLAATNQPALLLSVFHPIPPYKTATQ